MRSPAQRVLAALFPNRMTYLLSSVSFGSELARFADPVAATLIRSYRSRRLSICPKSCLAEGLYTFFCSRPRVLLDSRRPLGSSRDAESAFVLVDESWEGKGSGENLNPCQQCPALKDIMRLRALHQNHHGISYSCSVLVPSAHGRRRLDVGRFLLPALKVVNWQSRGDSR
jgi:hypothetical protein